MIKDGQMFMPVKSLTTDYLELILPDTATTKLQHPEHLPWVMMMILMMPDSDDIVSLEKHLMEQNVGFALSLKNTGVTSDLYGDENNVAQFRVDRER